MGYHREECKTRSGPGRVCNPLRMSEFIYYLTIREEPSEKTIVFLHEPSTLRSPSQPACLRFNILVQKNNVRETRSDMSKANRSQITWAPPDVCRLFSVCMGSWPVLVKWRAREPQ
jgi:hypothetical protein